MAIIERFKKILPKNRFARSVSVLAGGTAAGQAIVILVSPILTRLYTPTDFGILSLYAAIIGILGIIAGLRFEFALPIATTRQEAAAVVVISLILTFVISLLSWLTLRYAWGPIEYTFELERLRPYLWLVPVGISSVGIVNIFAQWIVREQAYNTLARSKLTQGIGTAGIQVGLGLLVSNPLGLITGDFLGRLLAAFYVVRHVANVLFAQIRTLGHNNFVATVKRYRRFPLLSAPASFFNTLGLRLPVILMAGLYGIGPAGWLMLSQRVIGGPMTLVGQSVARVYTGELGFRRRESPKAIRSLFLSMTVRLFFYCVLPILALAVLAPTVFEWAFGNDWYTAGVYTRLLSLMLLAQIIVSPISSTLTLLERQDLQLIWDGIRALTVLTGFWVAARTGLSDVYAVAIYSFSMSFLYAILWAISLWQIGIYSAVIE